MQHLVQFMHLPAVVACHLRIQQRTWVLAAREVRLQVTLACLHTYHPGVQSIGSTAAEDHVDEHVEIAVDLLDLGCDASSVERPEDRSWFISQVNSSQNSANNAGSIR